MTMKTSPFFSFNYGWDRGENGWNVGMDENLRKVSALFQRDIQGFVTVIPAMQSGDIYISTIDKNMYYNIDGTTYTVKAPANTNYTVNGVQYLWDGDAAIPVEVFPSVEVGAVGADVLKAETQAEGRTALGLGTAATQDSSAFEPPIALSPTLGNSYWNGNKAWVDFNAKAATVTFPNIVFTNPNAVVSTDTLEVALGKLQRQTTLRATLSSPAFTGSPTAPTAAAGTNTTQLATTAYVTAAIAAYTAPVVSVSGRTGAVVLTKTDVGLVNVDNTSDANKPVSAAQQIALNLKADLASPTFTGVPLAPTATQGNNSTQLATTAYVDVLGGTKAPLASPALTGVPTAPTAAAGTNTNQVATTAFVLANSASTSGNFLQVQEQRASGTGGGGPVNATYRQLNTVVVNQIAGASLSAGLVTLPAGNYYLESVSQFANVALYKTIILNNTDLTTITDGTGCSIAISGQMTASVASGYFSLPSQKTIGIFYYASSAPANGLGIATFRSGVEVYSDLRIWKLS